jgi:hypothetical protein
MDLGANPDTIFILSARQIKMRMMANSSMHIMDNAKLDGPLSLSCSQESSLDQDSRGCPIPQVGKYRDKVRSKPTSTKSG